MLPILPLLLILAGPAALAAEPAPAAATEQVFGAEELDQMLALYLVAFLARPDAVMDSVQRLRYQVQAAGNQESNEQHASVQPVASGSTAQPQDSGGNQAALI